MRACLDFSFWQRRFFFSQQPPLPQIIKVHIKEWSLPASGSLPHDPAVAPDGALWYTGQRSNTLGRLDPETGQIKEYPLKTPDSGPHGLAADKEGNIWFTANYKGYIGKLNPRTGAVAEYALPDPAARDPHTPVFDQKGILWFTVQAGNFVGRLDPETGAIKTEVLTNSQFTPLRNRDQRKRGPIFLRVRDQQARGHRSGHHGDHRVCAPDGCTAAAAHYRGG